MAWTTQAWGHDGGTFDGKDMRELVEAMFYAAPGVVHGLVVAQQSSPNNTVKVAAGKAVITATGAGLAGAYHAWNDADANSPTIDPTTTNGRKDRLIVRVTDGVPALEVVKGTASGSPAEPSITGDNYLELALITLPPSTSNITDAMITNRLVQASAVGGIITCTSTTRPTCRPGLHIFETNTGRVLRGTAQSEWATVTPLGATVAASQTTTSASYADLATVGPTVTLYTGTSVIVSINFTGINSSGGASNSMAVAVSGASTIAAADSAGLTATMPASVQVVTGRTFILTGLTPGENTFTAKYKRSAGTATFAMRDLAVRDAA